jgi:hypothetical protein
MRKGSSGRPVQVRLNIYLPEAALRREVKTAAASRDLSVSEYCLRAITAQLARDGDRRSSREASGLTERAVRAARHFQAQTFRNRVFTVSSADLIRETRERAAR